MIKFQQKGDFSKLEEYFKKSVKITKIKDVEQIAKNCIENLKEVTPVDSGKTAESWNYEIVKSNNTVKIQINNTNIQNGVNVALILEYGHGTKNGSWVEGKEYIAPAVLKSYLDVLNKTEKELKKL